MNTHCRTGYAIFTAILGVWESVEICLGQHPGELAVEPRWLFSKSRFYPHAVLPFLVAMFWIRWGLTPVLSPDPI
jgi:hypothetical protein